MCYGKDDDIDTVCAEDDVKRKSTKDRPMEVSIENLKSIRRNGDEVNQSIQLIQKPNCRTNASLGVPSGSFVGILQSCRMKADRFPHQPFNRLRS